MPPFFLQSRHTSTRLASQDLLIILPAKKSALLLAPTLPGLAHSTSLLSCLHGAQSRCLPATLLTSASPPTYSCWDYSFSALATTAPSCPPLAHRRNITVQQSCWNAAAVILWIIPWILLRCTSLLFPRKPGSWSHTNPYPKLIHNWK